MRKKARYTGSGAWTIPADFSDKLRAKLKTYFPDNLEEFDAEVCGGAVAFAEHVLVEARRALDKMHWLQYEITKMERRAELEGLQRSLSYAMWMALATSAKTQKIVRRTFTATLPSCVGSLRRRMSYLPPLLPPNRRIRVSMRDTELEQVLD